MHKTIGPYINPLYSASMLLPQTVIASRRLHRSALGQRLRRLGNPCRDVRYSVAVDSQLCYGVRQFWMDPAYPFIHNMEVCRRKYPVLYKIQQNPIHHWPQRLHQIISQRHPPRTASVQVSDGGVQPRRHHGNADLGFQYPVCVVQHRIDWVGCMPVGTADTGLAKPHLSKSPQAALRAWGLPRASGWNGFRSARRALRHEYKGVHVPPVLVAPD